LYALACGNHGALALYLPVLLLLTFWGDPLEDKEKNNPRNNLKKILILSLIFIIGITVYILLLIRSQVDLLPIDFGRTNNLERFWFHISDAKDRDFHTKLLTDIDSLLIYLFIHVKNITSNLFWLGLPFIVWGLRYLWVRYQILSVCLVVLCLINLVFFYYWIDGVSAFLPTLLAGFILLCLGLGQFGRFLSKCKLPGFVSPLLAVLIAFGGIGLLGPQRFSERESQAGFLATVLCWPDFSNVPPETVFLHGNFFSTLALSSIYSPRADVSVIHSRRFTDANYLGSLFPAKFPMAVFPTESDGTLIPQTTENYYSHFFNANLDAGKPIYLQFSLFSGLFMNYIKLYNSYLWVGEIVRDENAGKKSFKNGYFNNYLNWFIYYINKLGNNNDIPLSKKAPANIYYSIKPIIDFAYENGDNKLTERVLRSILEVFSDGNGQILLTYDLGIEVQVSLADNLYKQGRYNEAIEIWHKVIELEPNNGLNYFRLAFCLDKAQQPQQALEAMREAVRKDPISLRFTYVYSRLLAKYQSISAAIDFLGEKASYYQSEGMEFYSKLLNNYRSCLLLDPETDIIPGINYFEYYTSVIFANNN
jgi:tetratricopeptide (TPR) repeat protein